MACAPPVWCSCHHRRRAGRDNDPQHAPGSASEFLERSRALLRRFEEVTRNDKSALENKKQHEVARRLETAAKNIDSPLHS
jgi:hypothetical protein